MTCASFLILGSAMFSLPQYIVSKFLCRSLLTEILIIFCDVSVDSLYRARHFIGAMGLTRHERTTHAFHDATSGAHDFAAQVISIGIVDNIELIQFSTNNATMHFTFCGCLCHTPPPISPKIYDLQPCEGLGAFAKLLLTHQ